MLLQYFFWVSLEKFARKKSQEGKHTTQRHSQQFQQSQRRERRPSSCASRLSRIYTAKIAPSKSKYHPYTERHKIAIFNLRGGVFGVSLLLDQKLYISYALPGNLLSLQSLHYHVAANLRHDLFPRSVAVHRSFLIKYT